MRLAKTEEEIQEAQALRYEVFFEECGAVPDETVARLKKDVSPIDDFCDVLVVIDRATHKVVGTYRFMLREAALRYGGYFTATEFDVSKLIDFPGEIMELGRSCVHKDYRTRPTMQLLWKGIGSYMQSNQVNLCFGCGSFIGTDLSQYEQALSYLYYNHLAPPEIRPRVLSDEHLKMDFIPRSELNLTEAKRQLPPLIKGYLRLGGFIGEGIFVDPQFNSIDVCIVVKKEMITQRYTQRYTPRHSQSSSEAEA